MESKKHWVALNMVLGVGKTLFHRLVRQLGSPEQVFQASLHDLMQVEKVGEKTAREIINFDVDKNVEQEFQLMEKYGVNLATLNCPEYPELLKSIYDPPPILCYKGERPDNFPVPLAVVGTRALSSYGKVVADRLCGSLAEAGICIVSGLARGVDTLAHKAALASGGKTIAVLGCGLANIYPPENASLQEKITHNGSVISEFPMRMKPDRNNFPARNRVISGLSYGTVVVEAGKKSGALITAEFALEQGREVFAVPGNIYSPNSVGTNRLIKNGAKIVDGPESIWEELETPVRNLLKQASPETPDLSGLSDRENRLISILSSEEQHIDTLAEVSKMSPSEVSSTLIQLELKGMVRQTEGKMFVSNLALT
jgi:DNA processing protein